MLDLADEGALLAGPPVTAIAGIAGRRQRRLLPWDITTPLAFGPIPAEPWYYGFLVRFAWGTMTVGLLACGTVIVAGMLPIGMTLIRIGQGAEATDSVLTGRVGAGLIFSGLLGMVPVLMGSVPILLVVDVARNLRAIRYRQSQ